MKQGIEQIETAGVQPYEACKELSVYAETLIRTNQTENFRQLLQQVVHTHENCRNSNTRTAIENVLLYRIGDAIMTAPDPQKFFNILPPGFRKILNDQIYSSGI